MALEVLKRENIEGVIVAVTIDEARPLQEMLKGEYQYPVIIRVTYQRKRVFRRTGLALTARQYDDAVRAEKPTSKGGKIRANILPYFDKYVQIVKDMKGNGDFSLAAIPTLSSLGDKEEKKEVQSLYTYWMQYADNKDKTKTQEYYRSACRQFFIANGASSQIINRKAVLSGRVLTMLPSAFNMDMVEKWRQHMTDNGLTQTSQATWLRALRAVLKWLEEEKIIDKAPKLTMPKSTRRKDIFLAVPDILKLRDYEGDGKEYSDWWVMLYLCNGANLRDVASLRWCDDISNELTFTRSKTRDVSPSVVHIPITPLLQPYLDKYASRRKEGNLVFPQILAGAKTDRQIMNRVHDFNAEIRLGLQPICKTLGLPAISAEWSRNSYITTLTWHGISDTFIDDMVGHSDGKVISGYQGRISPKKRAKINSLLFTDPEEDE